MQSTLNRLKQHGLEIEALPALEEILPIQFREANDLAKRTLAIHTMLGIIFYPQPKEVAKWVETEHLQDELTSREKKWVFSITELPENQMLWKQQSMQSNLLTWKAESLYVLLWALGKLPDMIEPYERMDGSSVIPYLPELGTTTQPFIQEAKLRPELEILAELHYYLFLRHFMNEAYEETGEHLDGLESFIIEERFHALHWIACAGQVEWDDDWIDQLVN